MPALPWPTCSSFRSRCLNLSNRRLVFFPHLSAFQTIYDTRSYRHGGVFRLLRSLPRDVPPSRLKEL